MLLYMVIHKSSTENHWMYSLMWRNGRKKNSAVVPMYANTGSGLRGIGEAVGSTAVYPENDFDYLTDFTFKRL